MNTLTATHTISLQTLPMKLNIQGVGKQYRTKNWGLRNFTLELGPGVLGLLGPTAQGNPP